MRMLPALIILLITSDCRALGPDACWFEGTAAGQQVLLSYIDAEGYGEPRDPNYAYCAAGRTGDERLYLSCASARGAAEHLRYETRASGAADPEAGERDPTLIYRCVRGCEPTRPDVFEWVCEAGC